jgi:hypothetical protein
MRREEAKNVAQENVIVWRRRGFFKYRRGEKEKQRAARKDIPSVHSFLTLNSTSFLPAAVPSSSNYSSTPRFTALKACCCFGSSCFSGRGICGGSAADELRSRFRAWKSVKVGK